ncbi:restriction endonuclease subunit S [Citrobacter braakii]|uniref:restriction endonuclease subunit S n=1 Tax=Citrobacter braakii TaxID=57706 RepID=UPI001904A10F|nr:restriction endonuclease subunit S [Citrobacter braakii]EGT0650096.1 restriction endonuclease subunit S [Citrobacter braakii]EMC3651408.1 restriction endonuclease subunit S [Citrobacter braakii]MBJ8972969.1 restriction endonuclease subunit S [Citrobacter braakii]MDT7130809.1 restriction endonuclease subunit S [Citrobacter braakii]
MAKYKAYPQYKDSGVEWLGEIPLSWDMWKLSHAYEVIGSGTTPTSNNESWFQGNILWVTTGELRETVIYNTSKNISLQTLQSFPALKVHPVGSIIIAMYGATIGRLGILGVDATTNQACCAMTKSNVINNKYLYYWLQTFRMEIINLSSGGGQPNINKEKVASLKISSPSIKDQILIAAFLDHETTKIDNLIEKQQQLIELLKEKRQAVISNAVTKGLNPDVPMKDSGVEWLGEVPEHWSYTRIKYVSLLNPSKSKLTYDNINECTFLPMEKLKNNSVITDENRLIKDVINGYTYFKDGDLLVAKVTPCFENKNIAIAKNLTNAIGFGSSEIYVIRTNKYIDVDYLLYRLQENNFMCAATGAMIGAGGLKRIPSDFLLNYQIVIPPKNEMKQISEYLINQENQYNALENQAIIGIQLLQERRTALISAAVTGKIDVRNWVAPGEQAKAESPAEAFA